MGKVKILRMHGKMFPHHRPAAAPAIRVYEYILKNLCLVPFSFDLISYTHIVLIFPFTERDESGKIQTHKSKAGKTAYSEELDNMLQVFEG